MKPILELTAPPQRGYIDEVADYSDESADSVDEKWMLAALNLASEAEAAGEVPVGAVLVIDGQIAGRGYNSPVSRNDPTAHAEILALRQAAQGAGNYRLTGSTLYVTLEPCPMCAGAMVHARVGRLVYGARDLRFGAVRSKFRLADSDLLNHRVEVVEGVRAAESLERLQRFFARRRQ
jgi:tRNA(adenine34) deaminase